MNIRETLRLYAVTDRTWLNGITLADAVEQSIRGGVTFVQLREKHLNKEALIEEALVIKAVCKKYNVPFVINDDVEIAKAVDADGVHIGQKDSEISYARQMLGESKIIGVTARTIEQAVSAEQNGANYLGVGAVFGSATKSDAVPLKHSKLRKIAEIVKIPVVAIGGINSTNILQLSDCSVAGVAVISGIFAADDIEQEARLLRGLAEKL